MAGILLINLGTPEGPTPPAVRRYLREFLFDPEVIDIPTIPRWILVNLIIAPFRAFKSARAYQKVWTKEGSPLLIHTENLAANLQKSFSEHQVVVAMRYGNPSIRSGLERLKDESDIIVLPMYPQYAGATTRTVINKVHAEYAALNLSAKLHTVESFFEMPDYIESLANTVRQARTKKSFDHLLMSYHGLPIRQLPCVENNEYICKSKSSPCAAVDPAFPNCYRSHCYATSRALATALDLDESSYSVSFQSRLGNIPWIQPYTSDHIHSLVESGVKHLAVTCPAFVSDCLETLEEINMEIRTEFLEAGGESFTYIPCINDDPAWAQKLILDRLAQMGESPKALL